MNIYRLHLYDLWGNEDEGYIVNDVYRTSTLVELEDPWRASEVLEREGIVTPGDCEVDQGIANCEDTIYLVSAEDGSPFAELRLETASHG